MACAPDKARSKDNHQEALAMGRPGWVVLAGLGFPWCLGAEVPCLEGTSKVSLETGAEYNFSGQRIWLRYIVPPRRPSDSYGSSLQSGRVKTRWLLSNNLGGLA